MPVRKPLLLVLLLLMGTVTLAAQTRFEYWPGAAYDPSVPSPRKVLGYESGERISSHAALMKYMETLAAALPNRVRMFEYATSWQGRKLVYVAVGSEANIRRLDEIRTGMQRLSDPRKTAPADARKLIASLPAVVWLGNGVHGNEISGPEASLMVAYHLVAARRDKVVDDILANTLVLIDPTQNPDGRDRFVHHFEQSYGIEPQAHPLALEHTEPWPGGRTNHYLFDMNRDWFALTQPETRGRVKALLEWFPLVFVDLHEMGADSTYYFAPEAVPYNPHLAKDQRDSLEWFGRNNARWFDKFGFSYFTREIFDAFYPGYGASWPSFYGSVAMTYEQASARGLLMRRSDESVFHFRDTVRQQFVASIATAETAARHREQLLANFYRYRQTAIEEGQNEPVREYILLRTGDVSAVDKLALLLAQQGVEVRRATASFRNAGKEYPAGSYSISLAQPAKRLIRTLLDPSVPMEAEFVKEQERRRQKKLPDEIYDVTAWSLPLLYNVEAVSAAEASQGDFEMLAPNAVLPGRVTGGKAELAYLAPWGTAASGRLLTAALRAGLAVWSTDRSFRQEGVEYPPGTLIFKVKENPATIHELIPKLAAAAGASVIATNTGWVEDGVNFGSRHVLRVRKPNIALAWDTPASSYSAGHTRFVLERQYDFPVTAIRSRLLANADLSRFDVIILPDQGMGGYAATLGEAGVRRLKSWVTGGGTLIGLVGAVAFLADPKVALLSVAQEEAPRATEPPKRPEQPEARVAGKLLQKEEDYLKAIQPEKELPDAATGAIVRASLDEDHWITAGLGKTVNVLVEGRAIFTPVKLDKGVNAAFFQAPDQLLLSGHLWEENRKQMAYKPFVVVQRDGRGLVVGFTADPNFRAYVDGLNILFLNAVFRGAARATPAPGEGFEWRN